MRQGKAVDYKCFVEFSEVNAQADAVVFLVGYNDRLDPFRGVNPFNDITRKKALKLVAIGLRKESGKRPSFCTSGRTDNFILTSCWMPLASPRLGQNKQQNFAHTELAYWTSADLQAPHCLYMQL